MVCDPRPVVDVDKVALLTANLGNFEAAVEPVAQSVPCDFHRFTDANLPPRRLAMTPRLQARIPKLFGWQMLPGYEVYVWVDSSMAVSSPECIRWWLEQLDDAEAVFFRHPDRRTLREEADFIREQIAAGRTYLTTRYAGEWAEDELAEIAADSTYTDDLLIASTAFAYRPTSAVQAMMREWWYHVSRYHIVDQLGLPYALYKAGVNYRLIEQHYMRTGYMTFSRKSGRHHG